MIRVCEPGGTVLIADVCVRDEYSAQCDRMEKFRDNSHVHAITETEFATIFQRLGFSDLKQSGYSLDAEVVSLLDASSHSSSHRKEIMNMIKSYIAVDNLGINARYERDHLVFTLPI